MKKVSKMWGILLTIGLGLAMASSGWGQGLSFLEKNPELKAKLLQWEKEAPPEVKKEIAILRTGNAIAKGYAAVRLRSMGPAAKGAILALIETLRDSTPLEWRGAVSIPTSPADEAAEALEKIGEPAVEPLIQALKDKDWHVCSAAAEALGNIGDAKAVEPLIQALKDKDWYVRSAAAQALGKIGDKRAVEPLIQALKDKDRHGLFAKDWHVRPAAAQALGKIGDKRAVEPLIQALKDKDWHDRSAAAQALGKITRKDFGTDYHRWRKC